MSKRDLRVRRGRNEEGESMTTFESVTSHQTPTRDVGRRQAQSTGMRKWLDRLKSLQRDEAPQVRLPADMEIEAQGCASASEALQAREAERSEADIEWRTVALRRQIPATAPIVPLAVRPDVPYFWQAPDRCAMCGDLREAGQQFICHTCQRAKARVFAAMWS